MKINLEEDSHIERILQECGGRWDGNAWVIEDADLHPFVKTIIYLARHTSVLTSEKALDNNSAKP